MRRLLLLVGLSGAAACVPEQSYVYRPAELATATSAGRPAARYEIPPESPRGSARIASFGITEVETRDGDLPELHVRLILANNNDSGPWEIDARALQVAYASGEQVGPAFVNTGSAGAPVVWIPPGREATLDAYFPLPPGAEGAEGLPRFDLLWQVQTPERTVAERTPFERIRIEPARRAGPGPFWWYDPFLAPGPPIFVERHYILVRPRQR